MQIDFEAKVMLVDDNPVTLMYMEKYLKPLGFEMFLYKEPEQALQMVETIMPDVIILDIEMPGLNGFELCAKFKDIDSLQDVPILFVSAFNDRDSITKAFDSGATDFISKPIMGAEARSRVLIHTKTKKKVDALNDLLKNSFHELYAPLGVIESSVSILESKNGSSPYLDRITLAVRSLQSAYKDIYYAIKKETLSSAPSDIDLCEYLEQHARMLELLADAKEMKIVLGTVAQDLRVNIPEASLERIISNTITNAIKYGESKSDIVINCGKNGGKIFFEVVNKGTINKSVEKFFGRGVQADVASDGLGLGLDIVKSICKKFSIDINVLSDGGNTTFIYIFPKD